MYALTDDEVHENAQRTARKHKGTRIKACAAFDEFAAGVYIIHRGFIPRVTDWVTL
jgi:hypothetical protein